MLISWQLRPFTHIHQTLADWWILSTATWLMPCSPPSHFSCFALVPSWAFSVWWWLLGAFPSWGSQATSNPTQLTTCPGLPAILQHCQGLAGAWSLWGLFLLLNTPGLLPGSLPSPISVRGLSTRVPGSIRGQLLGSPLLRFTMLDQLEGQQPLAGRLLALMSKPNRFPTAYIPLPFSNGFYGSSSQQEIRIIAHFKWTL